MDYNRNNTKLVYSRNGTKPYYLLNDSPHHRKIPWDVWIPVPELVLLKSYWVIFLVAVTSFCISVTGDFVFDDSEAILNNSDLLPETPVLNIFRNDFWGMKLTFNTSHKSYRPLTTLTFRWNCAFSGGLHPFGFHLINIILHGIVSMLSFRLFAVFFQSCLSGDRAPRASFVCALLYAVHPIHTESVAGVVGRADLLSALFFILSFLAYTKSVESHHNLNDPPSQFSPLWIGWSLVLAGIAMLCKEQGVTVIGICSAYDIIVVCNVDILCLLRPSSLSQESSKQWLQSLLLRHVVLAAGGSLLLIGRWQVMGSSPPMFQLVDNPASFEESFLYRVLNYNYVYALNWWLLVHPFWLCFDWSMGCIPLIRSLTDPRLVAVAVFWMTASFLLYCCLSHEDRRIRRLVTMSVALLVIPFLPASNLFFRVGFVIAERVLYIPSLGFSLLVVVGFRQLCFSMEQYRVYLHICIIVLVGCFVVKSLQRSSEWRNEEVLFKSGLKVCPLNAKVHYNIAKNSADHGDRELAVKEYQEAIRLNPNYDQAMNNLANILKDMGELKSAEKLLLKAIHIRADFAAAWMNLGIVQSSLGKTKEAERSYLIALKHRRRYPDCYYNLGNLYLDQKRYNDAYQAWRNATFLRPSHLVAWNNMIIMLDSTGDLNKAESLAREALRYLPEESSLHFNLANTLGKIGKYQDSEWHFLHAIKLTKNNPSYYTNLGVLYHRWKKYDKAEEAYQQALQMQPGLKSARDNLELLHKTLTRLRSQH
ncbi:transmembrane O-mannosyltransferase targeting cadherins 4 isoform X1 [Tachypleus tridentatus]|uniref:transmembrane O-mannosyltransferase targeting cadherins 4 isoform X1 n=1 Tax=Tachypleus tridentatus TaxID=6853 RepID=UPI003FD51632